MAKELILPSLASPFAPYLFSNDTSDSAFKPESAMAHPPFLKDFITIRGINNQTGVIAPGEALSFETPKNGSRLGKCYLNYTVSAVSQTGGTTSRLPNWAGYELIDRVTVYYGGNKLQEFRGHDAYLRLYKSNPIEDLACAAALAGGNLTTSQRATAAQAPQSFQIDMPLWWTDSPHKYVPIENFVTGITVNVYFLQPQQVLFADGTSPTFTYSNCSLTCTVVNQVAAEVNQIRSLVASSPEGYIVPFIDLERVRRPLAAGTLDTLVDIGNQIKGHVSDFILETRAVADLTTSGQIVLDNEILPVTFGIKANSADLVRDLPVSFCVYHHWRDCWIGVNTNNYLGWSFSLNPEENFHTYGSVYFGGMRTILLHLVYGAGVLSAAAGYYVDMTCFTRNAIQMKGDTMVALLV